MSLRDMFAKIIRCIDCGKPHRVYDMYCGDQSRCSECTKDLEKQADMSRDEWMKYNSIHKLTSFWL